MTIILLLFTSFLFSCNASQKPESPTILEISKESSGQVTFKGKMLLLQLYENGEAEADVLILKTDKETKFERKRVMLSNVDFIEMQKLIKDLEKTDYDLHYSENAPASDVHSKTSIIFNDQNNQKIVIHMEENDVGILVEKYEKMYPKPLVSLLTKVYELRTKISN